MQKPYEAHERVYRRMKRDGIRAWGLRPSGASGRELSEGTEVFLNDILERPWAPRQGRVLEVGCGTGPILRWVCEKWGFSGLGIDVSPTAVAMAREQSAGLDVEFRRADACAFRGRAAGFDLIIDGYCLHCIPGEEDRAAFLGNLRRLLKPAGLLVVMTMCAPIDRKGFAEQSPGLRILQGVMYAPVDDAGAYEGVRRLGGRNWLPIRRVSPWRRILAELSRSGFDVRLFRLERAVYPEGTSDLRIAAAPSA